MAWTDVIDPSFGGGDPFLQRAHFGGQIGLIPDRRRHAAEQRGHFGPGLREPENIVHERAARLGFLHRGNIQRQLDRSDRHAGERPAARSFVHRSALPLTW